MPAWTSTDTNLETASDGIRRAAQQGAQLVLLQELHGSRYFCQTEEPATLLSGGIDLRADDRASATTRQLSWPVVIVGSLFEQRSSAVLSQHRCRA